MSVNEDPAEIEAVLEALDVPLSYDDAPEWLLELARLIVSRKGNGVDFGEDVEGSS